MAKSHASNTQKERRILTVQGWLIDGVQDDFILRQIKTEWDISLRQARTYLKWAYERWKQQEDITTQNKRDKKIADLQELRRSLKAEFKGTPSGINAIIRIEKEIIKLEGITPPKQHELIAQVNHEIKPSRYIDATSD